MGRRPLGQHFLIKGSVVHRILEALEVSATSHVLEIGPGKGALTRPLAQRVGRLMLVEKDPVLASEVSGHLSEYPSVEVVQEDFLKVPWPKILEHLGEDFRVISNLPYQAATAIMQKLLNHLLPGALMVLMFQKEVADRLIATPHTKAYGSLTVVTQIFSEVRVVMAVPPNAFRPPPQVDSTVLKFRMREHPLLEREAMPDFEKMLRAGFSHRRKMLRQNLREVFQGAAAGDIETRLQRVGANPQARAEELSVEQWIDLYKRQ